jgi:nitrite reductase/ring-hydroxylating ferredoxin subunit
MTIRPTAASSSRQPWETTPETRARKEPDPARDLGLAKDVLTGGRAVVNLEPDDRSVLIVKTFRGVFAIDDHCPHLGALLHTGTSDGRHITCARHNYQYDMCTGICFNRTFRNRPLTTYRAWIDHGLLYLATPAEQPQKARIPDARP